MAAPLVDIVIPTFNRDWSLQRAIDSVRRQTLADWRLIVVDDGSTDGTRQLVDSIEDDRIAYVYQDNAGVSAARNRGWQRGSAPWIAFLDSDDSWLPDKLARQLEALEADPRYEAVYTDEIWIRKGRRVNPKKRHAKYSGWIFDRCLPLCIISPSSILMGRRLLEDLGGFDPALPVCEDYDLWLRLTAKQPVLFLPEKLITKYGGHEDQLSASTWGLDRYRLQALEKLWQSGRLTHQQRVWTAAEAVRKADVVAAGFASRNKTDEAPRWKAVLRTWQERARATAAR